MASGRTDEQGIAYAIVSNIPRDYHSSDLRNYFSQFIEADRFECFHFRHRPEGKQKENSATSTTTATGCVKRSDKVTVNNSSNTQSANADSSNKTLCCVIKLMNNNLVKLLKMYHRKHWLDRNGDSISMICMIAKIKVDSQTPQNSVSAYKTRGEQRSRHHDEDTFTQEDLYKLIELHPPNIMPKGNVGTPTKVFLRLIQECRLPPLVIKKLGLSFPKTRTNKRYGNVPFDYGGEKVEGVPEEESVVVSGRGHQLEMEKLHTVQTTADSNHPIQNQDINNTNSKGDSEILKQNRSKYEESDDVECPNEQSESEEDNDSCEEWERHEAMYDDPSNQERNKERLFEEEIELKWEKGGSGLVFYTDAQYWDEKEGDFDERTADDWDVDMNGYYEENAGDKDNRDYITMRQEQRRRDGLEDTDMYTAGIGKFEKYTKGIGRKVMSRQGWKEGEGLGSYGRGMAEALDSEGQKPKDKSGIGYHGEKLQRFHSSVKRPHQGKAAIISTIYDDPKETDPPEKLLRRNEPYGLKYRQGIRFHKSETVNPKS